MGALAKNKKEAQLALINLTKASADATKRAKAEVLLARKHTIPGFDTPTPLVTFQEAMELVRLLPAKHTAHIIGHIDKTFQGVEAGDPRVQERVVENAGSNSVVARLARDGLGLPVQATLVDTEERALKRRRMAAEVEHLESKLRLETLRETKSAFLEVFSDDAGALEDRDRIMLFDMLRGMAFGGRAITNGNDGPVPPREEITIDELIVRAGKRPTHGDRVAIGRRVAAAFRARYGAEPPTAKRFVDGAQRSVKMYEKKEEDWIMDIVQEYYYTESE